MAWKPKAATKPPATVCFECGRPTTNGLLSCWDCLAKTAPFRTLAEPEKPRVGGDRRRKGGPMSKD